MYTCLDCGGMSEGLIESSQPVVAVMVGLVVSEHAATKVGDTCA